MIAIDIDALPALILRCQIVVLSDHKSERRAARLAGRARNAHRISVDRCCGSTCVNRLAADDDSTIAA